MCRDCGASYVLNSEDADFHTKLKDVCSQTKCKLGFGNQMPHRVADITADAVAGKLSGTVLNGMVDGSVLYVYGGLSEQPVQVSTRFVH